MKAESRLLAAAMVAVALGAGAPAFAGPSGESIAATCAGCHGPSGSSFGPVTPSIASLSVDYFVMSMKDYRDGKRPATVMDRIAKGYSDNDIAEMAKYFQKQTFVRHSQKTDPDKVKSGKALAKKYCESCHEDEAASLRVWACLPANGCRTWNIRHRIFSPANGRWSVVRKRNSTN